MRLRTIFHLTIIAGIAALLLCRMHAVSAQDIQIEDPVIKVSSENDDSGPSSKINLRLLIGQFGEKEFIQKGSVAQIGIPGLKESEQSFRFYLDRDLSTTTKASVKGGVLYDTPSQYRVYVALDGELIDAEGDALPMTRCDASEICTISKAASWKSTESYGVGYTVFGNDVSKDFLSGGYRPFANVKKTSVLDRVVESAYSGKDRLFELKNKANLKASEDNKRYQTSIIILATPGY